MKLIVDIPLFVLALQKQGACADALIWARNYATLDAAWHHCKRGDWMGWLMAKANVDLNSKEELRQAIWLANRKATRIQAAEALRKLFPYVPNECRKLAEP